MAVSTIKAFNVVQETSGYKSVASDTITALDTVSVPDTNAYYLVIGQVVPRATVSGKVAVCRLVGSIVRGDFATSSAIQSIILIKGNGSVVTLNANHNAGSAQTLDYSLKAIKLN